MTGPDLLRLVEMLQRERNISRETVFSGIEAALLLAAQKHFGTHPGEPESDEVVVAIDRNTGVVTARHGDKSIDPDQLGRIAAQSAKQLLIQKFREAECQAVFDEYAAKKGDLVKGSIQRFEHGTATVSLGKSEAILPRSEQIPGETYHVNDQVKAVITDVRKNGHRVRIVLSRTHPDFVRQLFIKAIPEIAERTIEIKAVAREAGYRTKVAVSSIDSKVDCVGACVGIRGSRIKEVVDELGGERIDIVRWNDSLQVLIPYALQPAQIEEVFLYPRLGRAIVLVQEDQLSLAIGRRGQNVRLASKLVGWDIEIMTHDELNESILRAEELFTKFPHVTSEIVETFIEEGFLSYTDVTFFEAADIGELAGLTEEQAQEIIDIAEEEAEQEEESGRVVRDQESRSKGVSSAASKAAALLGGGVLPPTPSISSPQAKDFHALFSDSPRPPVPDSEPEEEPQEYPPADDVTPDMTVEQTTAETEDEQPPAEEAPISPIDEASAEAASEPEAESMRPE